MAIDVWTSIERATHRQGNYVATATKDSLVKEIFSL